MDKTIPALEKMKIRISGLMNPNTTKPSDLLRVKIFEKGTLVNKLNEDKKDIIIITTIPYSVARK
jgi:hypothetical protein